ncbi:uncharacterized protein DNG_00604 [Cephalotrichum gorgonifer]|uniref:Uncharacterized protein n=1 Tax=Cephalotrichum gorgonifer TaxID=2041049 RepID=A0AAE8SRD5_9PEZI|nr:uncharacterized protein DNG_00604 [Cephalotrichum gorgonifer]
MASLVLASLRRGVLPRAFSPSFPGSCLQPRSLSTKTVSNDASRFTLVVPPNLKGAAVIEHLRKLRDHQGHAPTLSFGSDAAVVLATPAFTRWLTDESFMSALLATFASQDVQVLAGVVDDLHPLTDSGSPLAGFSILQGSAETLLPSLGTPSSPPQIRGPPLQGSLQFSLPGGVTREGPLSLNMPLANTVFQNGRESTLLASSWKSQSQTTFTLANTIEKTRQEIALPGGAPSLSVPLIPVTPRRKILGCLGNIISQIEIDGVGVPASTELENEVQVVYDRRAAAGNLNSEGMPVDIWALVSTPHGTVTPKIESIMDGLEAAEFDGPEEEGAVAQRNSASVAKLLLSGFQLHRITSGGGGWDKRRGRLSLDPTWSTSELTPDETMFLNLSDSGPAILQRGLLSPGSYIQFLTCPNHPPAHMGGVGSLVLGTSATRGGEVVVPDGEDVSCFWGHFGASSKRHFFLEEAGGHEGRVRTQVDSPFSYLIV